MTPVSISTVSGDELRASPHLRSEMHDLARPSYEDPTSILRREFADCTLAYLGRGADDRLVCFYMTTWETIHIDGTAVPTVHLGLSATRQDTKNSGSVAALYSRCVQDALAQQQASGVRFVLWSTTASPTVFLAVTHFLAEAEPHLDGSFSESGARIAGALRARLGAAPAGAGEHPFVLKNIAEGTRYSEDERRRIDTVRRRKGFTLFDRLSVDEACYDRLIFTARIPDDFRGRA